MKDDTENLLEIFKALSCRARFNIVVGLIKQHECNVTKMAEKLNIPQPNVSQHLSVLKKAGIIEGFRKGNQICYKVINEQVRRIIDAI
ncbi:MAG: metalloregulator ArsR/SmtB family transcription factor [Candidatus Gastranaerophilaceae bacterium]|jgi:ArsR family transcriptional regulator